MPASQLEPVAPALQALHLVILSHIQLEVLRHLAVVGQGLAPSRFVGGRDERHAVDLELVGRREESHVQGIAHQARDHGPLVEQRAGEAEALRGHAHREAARPGADHGDVERHVTSMIWSRRVPTLTYWMGAWARSWSRSR